MKALALAAAVAAGVICSAGTADAQFRSRGSYVYSYPTYTAPVYTAPCTMPIGWWCSGPASMCPVSQVQPWSLSLP